MIQDIPFKAGRFVYRLLGLSANQRMNRGFKKYVLTDNEGNKMIHAFIKEGKPAMISRFGAVETNAILNFLELKDWEGNSFLNRLNAKFKGSDRTWKTDVKENLKINAGFFPASDDEVTKFSELFIEKIKEIDAVGIWGFVPGETFLIEQYCPKAIAYDPKALEPYFFDEPWSHALAGKKVLVIHPFSKSIREQYSKRTSLFANKKVLPLFELKTITAVQSIAGNKTEFANWFEALHSMQQQIDAIDFDVAIIGAGSYGLPLSAYVKEKGKISIHIGGATQILFGIKGKRWDDHPGISILYNEYWVRPELSEIVPQSEKVEGGCYW